jgi:hypothetical protein
MTKTILTTAAVLGLLVGGAAIQAFAADATASAGVTTSTSTDAAKKEEHVKHAPHAHHLRHRIANQEKRIENGEKNGTITAKEAAKDEHHLAKVEAKAKVDAAANGGKLTAAEKLELHKKLNKNSKEIHDQKTDGATEIQDGTNQ